PEPYSPASYPWTWRVDFEANRFLALPDKLAPALRGLIGKSLAFNKFSFYLMLGAQTMVNHHFLKGYEIGPSSELGVIYGGKKLRGHVNLQAMQGIDRSRPILNAKLKLQTD